MVALTFGRRMHAACIYNEVMMKIRWDRPLTHGGLLYAMNAELSTTVSNFQAVNATSGLPCAWQRWDDRGDSIVVLSGDLLRVVWKKPHTWFGTLLNGPYDWSM